MQIGDFGGVGDGAIDMQLRAVGRPGVNFQRVMVDVV